MLNDKLIKLSSQVSELLDLSKAVIEKDYYVTYVINSIANIENDYFYLTFCGGTCLAKAHNLVRRMSEDVDFKIQLKESAKSLSKNKLSKELKKFREEIKTILVSLNLTMTNTATRNEGNYLKIELTYPSVFEKNEILRPHILLEFTRSETRLPTEKLRVKTMIEEVLKIKPLFSSADIACVSVSETAIEKWVGLTRRISAIERQYDEDDETLVRHIYDINAIRHANKITHDFFDLAKIIISNDAKQFKNKHPEYFDHPADEIRNSFIFLKSVPRWKKRYETFIEVMVYDKTAVLEYDDAIRALEEMTSKILA